MDASGDIPQPLVDHLREHKGDVPAFVLVLAAVAHADGEFDEAEQDELRGALGAVFGSTLPSTVLHQFVGEGLATLAEQGLQEALVSAGQSLAEVGMLEHTLDVALDLAGASEGIDESERAVILTVARAGGMSDEQIVAVLAG